MKKKKFALKLSCYLISLVMVATGVCTISYADTTSNSNDSDTTTQNQQAENTETTTEATTEASETTEATSESNDVQSNLITVKFVGINENTKFTSGSTDVKATISWNNIAESNGYTITGDGITKTTATASETNKTITITEAKKQKYTVTVATKATVSDGTNNEPLAKGTVDIDLTKYITDLKISTKTMPVSSDVDPAKLGKKLKSFPQRNYEYEFSDVAVEPTVTLEWTKVDGATGYKVYRYDATLDGNSNTSKIKNTSNETDLISNYYGKTSSKAKSSYSVVKPTVSGNKCKFSYKEYVEKGKYANDYVGYYAYRVVPVFGNDNSGPSIPSTLGTNKYQFADHGHGKNTVDRPFIAMKKFLNYNGLAGYHGNKYYEGKTTKWSVHQTSICTYKFLAKTNTSAKVYRKGKGNAYKYWIKKGKYGWANGGSGSKFEFHFDNTSGYVMRKKLSSYKVQYAPHCDWTKTKKESYANSSKKFRGTWVIWVSRYSQTVNVFKKNSKGKYELQHVSECTTGKFRNYTSSGVFKINNRWQYRKRGGHHYYYLSFYNGMNSVHGPTYYNKNNQYMSKADWHLKNDGSWGTLGCVRTYTSDAYWVWNHCKKGARVVVY